jgi:replicative DNA helicase
MTKRFDKPIEYRAINIETTELPHDDAAEEELIASCFASTPLLDSVADLVQQREFYDDARGRVFGAMQSLRVEGRTVTLGTVIARLRERDEVNAIGGIEGVSAMATRSSLPDPELVREYARRDPHAAHRREIAKALQVQLGEAYSGRTAHVKFVEGVESAVFNATRGIETVEEGVGLDVLVEREEERLREIEKGRVSSGGIPFGFGRSTRSLAAVRRARRRSSAVGPAWARARSCRTSRPTSRPRTTTASCAGCSRSRSR